MPTVRDAVAVGLMLLPPAIVFAEEPPPVMLANVCDCTDLDLSQYWISEKYDGIRAYWNGHQLLTRNGNRVEAPSWFTDGWPREPLDGELWAGRGQFETLSATVRDAVPNDAAWRRVRFMVFDLPAHADAFTDRLRALQTLLAGRSGSSLELTPQFQVTSHEALNAELEEVVAAGGEGLMLHRADSRYRAERSDDLLKLKAHQDAEARVIAHLPGNGKYENMLGALQVERADGLQFRVGSGFTDEQRRHPPPIGAWITYTYDGLTAKGVPRFARFLRVHEDRSQPIASDAAR